jgi:hypothetical protein
MQYLDQMLDGYVILFMFGLILPEGWIAVSLMRLPGTIAHELSHFFVGFLLRAYPGKLVLWPVREGNRLLLGQVEFANLTWYNAAFVGFSPLLLLPIVWMMSFHAGTGMHHVWMAYLEAVLIVSSIPSSQDLKIAFRFAIAPVSFVVLFLVLLIHH